VCLDITSVLITGHRHSATLSADNSDMGQFLLHISYIFHIYIQCESTKFTPCGLRFSDIFDEQLRISNQFLHTYYTFLSTLDYKFLLSHLKLQRSYAIHRVPKKETTKLLAITFSNLNRFLKFFHC